MSQSQEQASDALRPGSVVGGLTVAEVQTWTRRGGLYRVVTPLGSRLLKEILFPPDLTEAHRATRQKALSLAVESWQSLQSPLAIGVERFFCEDGRCYLVLPELTGSRLSVQARLRGEPPAPAQATLWADQLAALAQELHEREHPLAVEWLDADRMIADQEGHLTVFNPGWTEILWRDPQEIPPTGVQEGLRRYGQLLVSVATGDRQHPPSAGDLPHGLIWLVSRCSGPNSSSRYRNFDEVRQALRNLKVHGDEARNARALGSLPPLFGFVLPSLAPLHRNPRKTLIGLASLVALIGVVWTWLWWLSPRPSPRPALALAIGRQVHLWSQEHPLQRGWRFPYNVRCMQARPNGSRLYLGLHNERKLHYLDPDSGQRGHYEIPGEIDQLTLSRDQLQLLVSLQDGHLLKIELGNGHDVFRDGVRGPAGMLSLLSVPLLERVVQPQRPDRELGLVTVHPDIGLSLYNTVDKSRIRDQALLGSTSAIPYRGNQILCTTPEPTLHRFGLRLERLGQQEMPGRAGPVQLFLCPGSSKFWSLHSIEGGEGLVGLWSGDPPRCTQKFSLPHKPGCAAVDDRGRLWAVTQANDLYLIEQDPAQINSMAHLPGQVRAMAYLSPDTRPKGLDRIMASPPLPQRPR
jgi:hypothetical protein